MKKRFLQMKEYFIDFARLQPRMLFEIVIKLFYSILLVTFLYFFLFFVLHKSSYVGVNSSNISKLYCYNCSGDVQGYISSINVTNSIIFTDEPISFTLDDVQYYGKLKICCNDNCLLSFFGIEASLRCSGDNFDFEWPGYLTSDRDCKDNNPFAYPTIYDTAIIKSDSAKISNIDNVSLSLYETDYNTSKVPFYGIGIITNNRKTRIKVGETIIPIDSGEIIRIQINPTDFSCGLNFTFTDEDKIISPNITLDSAFGNLGFLELTSTTTKVRSTFINGGFLNYFEYGENKQLKLDSYEIHLTAERNNSLNLLFRANKETCSVLANGPVNDITIGNKPVLMTLKGWLQSHFTEILLLFAGMIVGTSKITPSKH